MLAESVLEPETLYHDILDQIADGVYLVDASYRIIYWNRAAERITGFGAAEVIGSRCSECLGSQFNWNLRTHFCERLCGRYAAA